MIRALSRFQNKAAAVIASTLTAASNAGPIFWRFAPALSQAYPFSGQIARNVSDFDHFKKWVMGVWPRVLMNEAMKNSRAMVSPFYPGAVERQPRSGKASNFLRASGFDSG